MREVWRDLRYGRELGADYMNVLEDIENQHEMGDSVDNKVDFRQSGFEKGTSGRPFQR